MSDEVKWQPISTAPKNWQPILVWAISEDENENAEDEEREPKRSMMVAQHSDVQSGNWWLHGTMERVYGPTHWMPLPPAPQPDSDGGGA